MNFSDETVEKVRRAIEDVAPNYWEYPKAALSSLTLADLMQVEEVRGLVEAARSAFQEYDKTDDGAYYSKMDDLLNAITPFTEPK